MEERKRLDDWAEMHDPCCLLECVEVQNHQVRQESVIVGKDSCATSEAGE